MAFETEGKLHKIFPTEQKTASFAAREFVVEIPEGKYPQYIKFQLVQDRCGILDNFREGEKVKVSFDLKGRPWQDKFFTTLDCWKLERTDGTESVAFSAPTPPPPPSDERFPADPFPNYADQPQTRAPQSGAGFEDLPF